MVRALPWLTFDKLTFFKGMIDVLTCSKATKVTCFKVMCSKVTLTWQQEHWTG